jgi:hypothetical protein
MTTTITLNLTQADLQLLLVATTRLLIYCTAQKRNGNDYAAQSIPNLVEMNHQIVLRLQILKRQPIFNQTQLATMETN